MILRLMAVKHYFNDILSGKSLVKASNDAAVEVWHTFEVLQAKSN